MTDRLDNWAVIYLGGLPGRLTARSEWSGILAAGVDHTQFLLALTGSVSLPPIT